MHIVIALGGNALLQRGQAPEASNLHNNVIAAAQAIAPLAAHHHITLVHGNGPQVGLLALQAEAYSEVSPYPFDVLDAESQGMIGYLLQQALSNCLPQQSVVTLLTQVIVAQHDPAFNNPTKPIGPVYSADQVAQLRQQHSWTIKPDGEYFRRVVPSPQPQRIHELTAMQTLVQAGHIVVVGGGGGIPCIVDAAGHLQGIEAVIDKDLTAALLAKELQADVLMILTDVDAVYRHWGEYNAQALRSVSVAELEELSFAAGSMQPKINAACQFVTRTGNKAMIGQLTQVSAMLAGEAGTHIT